MLKNKINKYDLIAYKHNDHHQYSLVPGFNVSKYQPTDEMIRSKHK